VTVTEDGRVVPLGHEHAPPQQQPAIIMLTGQSFLPGIHEAMRVTLTRWPAM
jgi:hypothetical protein